MRNLLLFTAAIGAALAPAPLAAQPSAVPATVAPIPIEDFARLPSLSGALLSPDGRRIAGRVSDDGNEVIQIWTLDENRDTDPIQIAARGNEAFEWAGDARLLITSNLSFVIALGGVVLPVLFQRVYSYDLDTRRLTPLGPGAGFLQSLIFVDPAGRYALLSSQERVDRSPRVLRVDLASGQSVEVQPPQRGVWSWFADSQGVVRVGVDYGERRTRIYYRPDAQSPLSRSKPAAISTTTASSTRSASSPTRTAA